MQPSLPACRHRRGPLADDQWNCFSPKVICPDNRVTGEMCRSHCAYVDHPHDPRFSVLSGALQVVPLGSEHPRRDRVPTIRVAADPDLLSIGMLTAPRVVPLVAESIRQLRQGGFGQTIELFAEPESPWEPMDGVRIHGHERRLGCWGNFRHAARYLLDHTTTPFILICEDDILLAADAALGLQYALETVPTDTLGYISLYTPWHNVIGQRLCQGWQALPVGGSTWGALGYCFSRESLEFALTHTPQPTATGAGHPDIFISTQFARAHRPCYFHVPSLCSHAGKQVSTLGHNNLPDTNAVDFAPQTARYVPARAATGRPDRADSGQGEHLYALTSLSPAVECVPRTRQCLDSWQRAGLKVLAFNHPSEIETLAAYYEGVEFVPVTETTISSFGRHYVPINVLLNWAADHEATVLVINSDIELRLSAWELQRLRWRSDEGMLCLVRYNHGEDEASAVREPYGIDGFLLHGRHAGLFRESFLSLGQPAWDYWLPAVFADKHLPLFTVHSAVALHRTHPLRWSPDRWHACALELDRVTGRSELNQTYEGCVDRSARFRENLERRLQVIASKPPPIREWVQQRFRGPSAKLFLELGAHQGCSTRWLSAIPGVRLHAFEPDPRNDQPPLPNVQLHRAAISDHDGHGHLVLSQAFCERTNWTYSSSLKQPKNHLRRYPVTFGNSVEVQTIKLDSFHRQQGFDVIDFIWADVQGAEGEMIRGGKYALSRTRFLYTEYSNDEMYENQITLEEILSLLPNFRVVELWADDVLLENVAF